MDADKEVLPPKVNLVRFGKPELLTRSTETKTDKTKSTEKNDCSLTSDVNNETLKCSDVLDRMQMTRKWEKNGECYQQKLSTHPGTKMDVKNLNEKLDMYLKQFNAREVGICPIKEQLYLQCFNEIIRQVTIECPEQGNLLIRLRDEMKITIDGYRKLHESVMAKGIRKVLLSEKQKSDSETIVQQHISENEKLEAELAEKIKMTQKLVRDMADAREEQAIRNAKESNDLKEEIKILKDKVRSIVFPR